MTGNEQPDQADFCSSVIPSSCDSRVRRLYDYWLSIHPSEGGLPGRQHFDPTHIPALLPWVWLVDVHRSPLRFKHRLLGTEHVHVMKRDVTGLWVDEVHPLFVTSPAYPQFVATAERGEVWYRRGNPLFHLPKEYLSMERLLLPLAQDGKDVDMILAITVYHPRG